MPEIPQPSSRIVVVVVRRKGESGDRSHVEIKGVIFQTTEEEI